MSATPKMIHVGRHEPTAIQTELAAQAGSQLVYAGDVDHFNKNLLEQLRDLTRAHGAEGVACTHPVVALETMALTAPKQSSMWFRESVTVGVFSNEHVDGGFIARLRTYAMNYAVKEAGWFDVIRGFYQISY